jgi:hypothetical protein
MIGIVTERTGFHRNGPRGTPQGIHPGKSKQNESVMNVATI